MSRIIRLKLGKIAQRVAESYGAEFEYSENVVDAIRARCTEVDTGARNVDHILNRTLLPELSAQVLANMAENQTIAKIAIDLKGDHEFDYKIRCDESPEPQEPSNKQRDSQRVPLPDHCVPSLNRASNASFNCSTSSG
jgi:hypothetical protein